MCGEPSGAIQAVPRLSFFLHPSSLLSVVLHESVATANHQPLQNSMPTKQSVTRILLVDDHPICREGLREIIETQKDLSVCGTAEDIHSALIEVEKLRPDLVVIDISLKDSNGLDLLKDLKVRVPAVKV